ncbi:hypothetical protein BAE44_0016684, partial [Dichanthelium oligosanthes]
RLPTLGRRENALWQKRGKIKRRQISASSPMILHLQQNLCPATILRVSSCLKGDDIPYDQSCHNYKNNGMCIRGDGCRFSHVVYVNYRRYFQTRCKDI